MQDPTTVCLFIPHLALGGAELQLSLLARELPGAGFRPIVATLKSGDEREGAGAGLGDSESSVPRRKEITEALRQAGIPVHVLPRGGPGGLGSILALARLVRRERAQILHAWLFAGNWRGALARLLAPRTKVLLSIRSMEDDIERRHEIVYRLVAPLAHAILVNARAVRDRSAGRTGIPSAKYRVVGNAVPIERLDEEAREDAPGLSGPRGGPVAGLVGLLRARKRVRTLPRIAPALLAAAPQTRFLVVGDGDQRALMEEDCARLGVSDRFFFAGYQERMGRYVGRLSVLIHPSMNEGCCNAILEAAALGVPVVAYAVGGNPEIVQDGKTGFLVGDDDEAALSERAAWLLTHPEEARAMGERARSFMRTDFSVPAMTQRTVAVYREALGRGPLADPVTDRAT